MSVTLSCPARMGSVLNRRTTPVVRERGWIPATRPLELWTFGTRREDADCRGFSTQKAGRQMCCPAVASPFFADIYARVTPQY